MNAAKKRIEDGLAKGKTFYLRGGKKLKGVKAETAKAVPPVASAEEKTDSKNDGKDKDKDIKKK
jgi:hypothetical protein